MDPHAPKHPIQPRGDYIAGAFRPVHEVSAEWVLKSPASLKDEIGRISCSYASVDDAVGAARSAFRGWRKSTPQTRADCLKRYQEAIKKREAALCEIISRETGKPLWESKTEVASMLNKIDITLTESLPLIDARVVGAIQEGTRGRYTYRPLGVMAVLGPFNFPGHLPNGHIVPALATGNTVVFKPSEKTPLTGQLIAECVHESGFPEGVFNLVQGEKEVGRRLAVHEHVDGVLFTGSYEVGNRIKQDTLTQHWKLLALEMGGKNPTVIWSDADLKVAMYDTLTSAFLTTGQRCSSTSRVLIHRSIAESFVEEFHRRSKAFSIGHPYDHVFMGPLIDQSSVDRYLKFQGIAAREGFELVMRGKALEAGGLTGHYVTPSIAVAHQSSVEQSRKAVTVQTELFAPLVAFQFVEDLDEAIAMANATSYGLVASVFTRDRATYERCREDLQFGLVNWNKPTVGASSRLPFGGFKKSGNHMPTALTSVFYCAAPVSSLECEAAAIPATPPAGLNWDK